MSETQFWLTGMYSEVLAESGTTEHVIFMLSGSLYLKFIPGNQTALYVPWFIYLQVLVTHLFLTNEVGSHYSYLNTKTE